MTSLPELNISVLHIFKDELKTIWQYVFLDRRMRGWGGYGSYDAAKGTDLGRSAGKEDPVELDSSLLLWRSIFGVE